MATQYTDSRHHRVVGTSRASQVNAKARCNLGPLTWLARRSHSANKERRRLVVMSHTGNDSDRKDHHEGDDHDPQHLRRP